MRKSARTTLLFALLAMLLVTGCSTLNAVGALLGNEVTFSPPQLQQALNRNFPKHYDKLDRLGARRIGATQIDNGMVVVHLDN